MYSVSLRGSVSVYRYKAGNDSARFGQFKKRKTCVSYEQIPTDPVYETV
jgi:hypothetical protein